MWNFLSKIRDWFKIEDPDEPDLSNLEPENNNYEQSAAHLTDFQLAKHIREMGLRLGHTSRQYAKRITNDRDDEILKNYFMSAAQAYPSRFAGLKEIWNSYILDDNKNTVYRERKIKEMFREQNFE